MADGRGMPLLSGPPTNPDPSADISCRKCNKDLRGLFARERRCNHCGMVFVYCTLFVFSNLHDCLKDICIAPLILRIPRSCHDRDPLRDTMQHLFAHSVSSFSLVSLRFILRSCQAKIRAVTAAGRAQLKAMPLAKLRRYIDAYNLKATGVIEKGELVDIIINARVWLSYLEVNNDFEPIPDRIRVSK